MEFGEGLGQFYGKTAIVLSSVLFLKGVEVNVSEVVDYVLCCNKGSFFTSVARS